MREGSVVTFAVPKEPTGMLTTSQLCEEYVVRAGVCVKSGRRLECLVNRRIHRAVDVRVVLPHLGATDCTCQSHLVKVDSSLKTILARVNKIYCEFGDPFTFHVNRGVTFSAFFPSFQERVPENPD